MRISSNVVINDMYLDVSYTWSIVITFFIIKVIKVKSQVIKSPNSNTKKRQSTFGHEDMDRPSPPPSFSYDTEAAVNSYPHVQMLIVFSSYLNWVT